MGFKCLGMGGEGTLVTLSTAVSITMRVLSSIVLCGLMFCLGASLYNLFVYARSRRLNQTLIVGFYATGLLLVVSTMIEWVCAIIDPSFFANYLLVTYGGGSYLALYTDNKGLYNTLQPAQLISCTICYLVYWVVFATTIELSSAICVLAGHLTPRQMNRRRVMSFTVSITFALGYTIAMTQIMLEDWVSESMNMSMMWISFVAEICLAIAYTIVMFAYLMPAIKKI